MLKWNSGLVCFPACTEVFFRNDLDAVYCRYRNSWIWSDDTIAHFIKLSSLWSYSPRADSCATLSAIFIKDEMNPLFVETCDNTFVTSCLLCEIRGTSSPYEKVEPPEIRRMSSSKLSKVPQFIFFLSECDYLFVKLHNTISRNTRTFIKCLWWRKTIGIYLGIIVPR